MRSSHEPAGQVEEQLAAGVARDPEDLNARYLLYRYYFRRGLLAAAESAACEALLVAARQARLPVDWHRASANDADWSPANPSARFYLFTLKALAFILLRREDRDTAQALLGKLAELDPQDSVGADVIRDLAAA